MWDSFSDLMTQEKNTEKHNENEYWKIVLKY